MFKILLATAVTLLTATSANAGEKIEYVVGGETFSGYLAAAEAPHGTIVILPTWNGLSDYEMDRAEMLSNMGYNAFAADLYAIGTHPTTMEERQTALGTMISDQARMHEILTAALAQARSHGGEPLIVMGYSMGGIVAMELAWSNLGNELGVDGYAIFSGRVSDNFGRMMPDGIAPFFIAHGEADTQVQVSGLENFVDDVDLAGSATTVHTYPGAGHLFSAFGFPNYDAEADQHSWSAFSAFLEELAG